MDFSKTLFRASSIGNLMTEPKLKADKEAGNLSEGAKTHLVDIFVSNKYGRQTDINSKYITKGLMVEEDSITLYSRLKKQFYKKNESTLSNEFVRGTPDLYIGEDINKASIIIDVKSSWDIYTFFRTVSKPINNIYYWQLQCYMALTGAKSARLAYCLVNTPDVLINDEKNKLMWRMGAATSENAEFLDACKELDKAMVFDDIPLNERLIEFTVDRNDEDIEAMYKKVSKARIYLIDLDKKITNQNKIVLTDLLN